MKKIKNYILKNSVYLSIFWVVVIFILCATPGQYIPSANWLELISFDKFVHAGMFFVLCSLLFITSFQFEASKSKRLFYFISTVAYGCLLEIMQSTFFINRSTDWKDIVANTFGCVMAFLFLKKLRVIFG